MTDDQPVMPAYMRKHPCSGCGVGYGVCASGWERSLLCCHSCCHECSHPSRWGPDPWTDEDREQMKTMQGIDAFLSDPSTGVSWAGRERRRKK